MLPWRSAGRTVQHNISNIGLIKSWLCNQWDGLYWYKVIADKMTTAIKENYS